MQESSGCVRAPTTYFNTYNPGLMQSFNGPGSCNNDTGYVQNSCPARQIEQMISDGVAGVGAPPQNGLLQCLQESGTADISMYYRAARIYNSGQYSLNADLGYTDLSEGGSTAW